MKISSNSEWWYWKYFYYDREYIFNLTINVENIFLHKNANIIYNLHLLALPILFISLLLYCILLDKAFYLSFLTSPPILDQNDGVFFRFNGSCCCLPSLPCNFNMPALVPIFVTYFMSPHTSIIYVTETELFPRSCQLIIFTNMFKC